VTGEPGIQFHFFESNQTGSRINFLSSASASEKKIVRDDGGAMDDAKGMSGMTPTQVMA
jgi:hypothetical protein